MSTTCKVDLIEREILFKGGKGNSYKQVCTKGEYIAALTMIGTIQIWSITQEEPISFIPDCKAAYITLGDIGDDKIAIVYARHKSLHLMELGSASSIERIYKFSHEIKGVEFQEQSLLFWSQDRIGILKPLKDRKGWEVKIQLQLQTWDGSGFTISLARYDHSLDRVYVIGTTKRRPKDSENCTNCHNLDETVVFEWKILELPKALELGILEPHGFETYGFIQAHDVLDLSWKGLAFFGTSKTGGVQVINLLEIPDRSDLTLNSVSGIGNNENDWGGKGIFLKCGCPKPAVIFAGTKYAELAIGQQGPNSSLIDHEDKYWQPDDCAESTSYTSIHSSSQGFVCIWHGEEPEDEQGILYTSYTQDHMQESRISRLISNDEISSRSFFQGTR